MTYASDIQAAATTSADADVEKRGQYLCEGCARFFHAPGTCSICLDEPLVNVHDEAAVELLRQRARQRRERYAFPCMMAAAAVMLPLNALLAYGLWEVFLYVAEVFDAEEEFGVLLVLIGLFIVFSSSVSVLALSGLLQFLVQRKHPMDDVKLPGSSAD